MRKLEHKYASELVVIGVHSAKFPNEKEGDNLRKAVQRYELRHPVVNDAEFLVWQEYACRAWPTLMFIDPQGKVIGKHEGELPYEAFDNILGEMVAQFNAQGLLDHTPLSFQPDTPVTSALSFPGKVLSDAGSGRLCIADSNHNRILVADLDGAVRQVIGSGQEGLDDGSFAAASFNHPQGLALSGDILYVADTDNHAIRRVDLAAQMVETIAGTGEQGFMRQGQGQGTKLALNSPWDLALHGNVLYIAMAGAHQLWSLTLADGQIGPYAGSGREAIVDGPLATAALAQPSGLTTDGKRLYFADSETSSIRYADLNPSGRVGTIVGLDLFVFGDIDGAENHVRLQHPLGIAHADGTLYVADTYNHKIKRVLPATRSAFTLLGTGQAGYRDGAGGQAQFSEPSGLSIARGKLYIADTNNHLIRVADLASGVVGTVEISGV
ncbi:MAG: alkyl hydroperoxide reductase [Dehalococcoidia bacterium]|nr:alkyl hydroperoxide reductase [Dehalococcoidia bacterium]MSQ16472.1 alkyl hydroperoxide reductase [Dehalococcoidia bacterium]